MTRLARIRQLPHQRRPREFDALVWVDPARLGGTPAVFGHRLTVEMVAEYVWHGLTHDLEYGYDLPRALILGACAYVVRYGHGLIPPGKRPLKSERWIRDAQVAWAEWWAENRMALWYSRYDEVPYPPSREVAE